VIGPDARCARPSARAWPGTLPTACQGHRGGGAAGAAPLEHERRTPWESIAALPRRPRWQRHRPGARARDRARTVPLLEPDASSLLGPGAATPSPHLARERSWRIATASREPGRAAAVAGPPPTRVRPTRPPTAVLDSTAQEDDHGRDHAPIVRPGHA
jgi:hypothetical protein